ncbi:MAG: hypothetical protein CMG69_04100 [Candidatus Marinimicrobia bacterium]|nr:hypothetical protein [Candidatus Neomarinimicrobiota bacterium]|tara:strand:- start:12444 stop:15356 length:2913 start_codon:yes stop_codon:yes gene_type:complete
MEQKKNILIDSPSVLKNYNHPIGRKIIERLTEEPLSANKLSELIGFPRDNIYYHIKKLVKNGLLIVSETEIINGITKKKYMSSAKTFEISDSILPSTLPQKKGKQTKKSKLTSSPEVSSEHIKEKNIKESPISVGPEKPANQTKIKPEGPSQDESNQTSLRDLLASSLENQKSKVIEEKASESEKTEDEPHKNKEDTLISLKGNQYILSIIDSENISTTLSEDLKEIIKICDKNLEKLYNNYEIELQKQSQIGKRTNDAISLLKDSIEFAQSLLGKTPKDTGTNNRQSKSNINHVNEDLFNDIVYFNKKNIILVEKLIDLFAEESINPKKTFKKDIEIEIRTFSHSLLGLSEMLVENMLVFLIQNVIHGDGELLSLEEKGTIRDSLMEDLIEQRTSLLKMPALTPEINLKSTSSDEINESPERKENKRWLENSLLYLFRLLNGYSEILTFVKQGDRINFLQASVKLDGFKVIRVETFRIPMRIGHTQIESLNALILHVYKRYIPPNKWKKYYLSYFTTDYPIALEFMSVPNMKKSETAEYIKNTIANNFSIDSNKLSTDWILQDGRNGIDRTAVCTFTDRDKIISDYQACIDNGIQPRFITSVSKLQYDIYRYLYVADSSKNALLIYFDRTTTWITLINNRKMVDSRQCWVGMNDFVDALSGVKLEGKTLNDREAEEWLIRNGVLQNNSTSNTNTDIILLSVFQKFISDIQKTLRHFSRKGKKDFDIVYLDGPGAEISNIISLTSQHIGKKTVHMNIDLKKNISETDGLKLNENDDYSENIGLLLDPRDRLNLIPEQARTNINFLLPTRLTQIIGLLCTVFFLFFVFSGYLKHQDLKTVLPKKITEIQIAKSNQELYYKYLQDITVIKGFDRVKENDRYVSQNFTSVLKYLSETLPEIIKLNLLEYNGENPQNLLLSFTGKIDAADYESDVILRDLKYRLEKSDLFKTVDITSKRPGPNKNLIFQMSTKL